MEYLKTLYQELPHGIMLCKCLIEDGIVIDSLFLDVNSAYEDLVRMKKEELLNKRASEMLPGTESEWFEAFDKVLTTKKQSKKELFHAPTEKYYEADIIYYEKDQLIVVFKDITDKTIALQNLIDANNRFKALSETTFEAVIISDNGICIESNQAASEMFGYSHDEMIGMHGKQLIAEESKELVKQRLFEEFDDPFEAVSIRKDGATFPVEIHVRMYDYQGKQVRVTTMRDLSLRKKSEQDLLKKSIQLESAKKIIPIAEQLANSNQELIDTQKSLEISNFKYRQAQSIGKIGHWEYDHSLEKYQWSDEVYNIYNVSKQTFSHNIDDYFALIHIDDAKKVRRVFNRSLNDKSSYEIIFRINVDGANIRYLKQTCIHEYDEDGKPKKSLGTVQNVTEQIRNENLLKKKNRERDRFIGVLGHDLTNTIGGSLSLLKIITKNRQKVTQEDKMIFALHENIDKSYSLLSKLVLWGKASLGKVVYNPCLISTEDLKEQLNDSFIHDFRSKNIEFNFSSIELSEVYADVNMLMVILRNLITNALKYTPHDGKISLEISKTKGYTHFCIADNGIGMEQSVVDGLFELSNLSSKPGLEGETGSGFGLQLVHEYVEMHKGSIWIESEVNIGTKVYFTLIRN